MIVFCAMALDRRSFIGWLLSLTFVGRVRDLYAAVIGMPRVPVVDPLRAFAPYMDTLIPADDSPSATDLGVDQEILSRIRNSDYRKGTIMQGCRWLDAAARKLGATDFVALDLAGREAVVTKAAQATRGTPPHEFFRYTRYEAFQRYYANPESWIPLNYRGPPQPLGFSDYTQPPAFKALR